jgi:hypothetical protein
MRITFDTSVQLSDDSPTTPTVDEVDADIERAFDPGTTFLTYLTSVLAAFPGTPFETVFSADWVIIDDPTAGRR